MTTKEATGPRAGSSVLRLPNLRQARRSDWAQLVRFCLVGASGYVVNLAVFAVAFEYVGMHHVPAAAIAFVVAWINNFALNKGWTFRGRRRSPLIQGARYMLVSLAALATSLVLLEVLVQLGAGELVAQSLAVIAVTPVSFLLNRRWSFR